MFDEWYREGIVNEDLQHCATLQPHEHPLLVDWSTNHFDVAYYSIQDPLTLTDTLKVVKLQLALLWQQQSGVR